MTVTITWQTIITAGAVLTAMGMIFRTFYKSIKWMDRQREQDVDLAGIKHEQTILTDGVLACLKGLKEQGCDGPVTDAINKIEKHLNQRAHDEGGTSK